MQSRPFYLNQLRNRCNPTSQIIIILFLWWGPLTITGCSDFAEKMRPLVKHSDCTSCCGCIQLL